MIAQAYLSGRKELSGRASRLLAEKSLPEKSAEAVFWENCYADETGSPRTVSGAALPSKQFNAVAFTGDEPPEIEKIANWRRLRVAASYFLDLTLFASAEEYFLSLSGKNRKKLRWIRNSMPKMNCRISHLVSDEDFADFERLYAAQFPKHPAGSPVNTGVREIYRMLEAEKRNFSRLLRDPDGNALAACLAYRNGESVFYTHLTRSEGAFDKYSPGYYLTYMLITELLEKTSGVSFFFMGPGYYEYKTALGGRAFPVFRYVENSWRNLFALIRLRHRAAKERRCFRGA